MSATEARGAEPAPPVTAPRDFLGLKTVDAGSFAKTVLASPKPVAVFFWAEWCGPCQAMLPSLARISGRDGTPAVVIVDIDSVSDVASDYGVRGIPMLIMFRGGKITGTRIGAAPANQLAAWLDEAAAAPIANEPSEPAPHAAAQPVDMPVRADRVSSVTSCGNPVDPGASPPAVAGLRPYVVAPGTEPPRQGSVRALIRSVERLNGQSLQLGPAGSRMPTPGPADATIDCALLAGAQQLFAAGGSDAARQAIDGLGWVVAGRYTIASDLYQTAQEQEPAVSEDILRQLGLGTSDFENLLDRIAAIAGQPLNLAAPTLVFKTRGGTFNYVAGQVLVDPLGIKRLIAANFLLGRTGYTDLPTCLTGSRFTGARAAFCQNLVQRIKARLGKLPAPGRSSADSRPGDPVVAGTFARWREAYGAEIVAAYIDETWAYLEATARGSMPAGGASEPWPTDYLDGDDRDLKAQLMLVLGHELGHHLLRHDRVMAQLATDQPADLCKLQFGLEAQADIVGSLLFRLRGTASTGDSASYRNPIAPDGADVPADIKRYARFASYFDGYVNFYESRSGCGYFQSASRHVLTNVVLSGSDWAQ